MSNSLLGNLRFALWAALALLLFVNYQAWMHDYPAPESVAAPAAPAAGARGTALPAAGDLGARIPEAPKASAAVPTGGTEASREPAAAAALGAAAAGAGPGEAAASPGTVEVRTDVLDVDISTRGGTLARVDLLAYPKVKGEAAPVRLENDDDATTLYELQSGLTGPAGASYPTHLASYSSEQTRYALDGARELRVPLTWSESGITVTKTFVFRRGEYRIEVDYQVHNGGTTAWSARPYAQILRNDP
ncbi:MAG: membrane protein insertase YidC, partial [Gammaproteobacteria bacterium]|nr:membrane protein insertase YidC [Gammaproteobacteria bacterium]